MTPNLDIPKRFVLPFSLAQVEHALDGTVGEILGDLASHFGAFLFGFGSFSEKDGGHDGY